MRLAKLKSFNDIKPGDFLWAPHEYWSAEYSGLLEAVELQQCECCYVFQILNCGARHGETVSCYYAKVRLIVKETQ